jgi:hypothetical protein
LFFDEIIVLALACLGSWLEGALLIILYMKVRHLFKKRGIPPGSGIYKRTVYTVSILFIIIGSIWIGIYLTFTGRISKELYVDLAFIWTVSVFAVSFISIFWKLKTILVVERFVVVVGVAMMIAGTTIFNFRNIIGDIALYFATKVFYGLGFWSGVFVYLRMIRNPNEYVT